MKKVKSFFALLLAVIMTLALGTTAFAVEADTTVYSITVNNTNTSISMEGQTYSAYKLFDVTYDNNNFSYTAAEAFKGFAYTVGDVTYTAGKMTTVDGVEVDELYNYLTTVANDSEALNTFAEAALDYVTAAANNVPVAGSIKADAKNSATIELGKDAAGYYLVAGTAAADNNQTVVAACALTTTTPTADVNVKADAPSVDKKIVEGNAETDVNTASIGDTVNYKITSKVPNMIGYEKYFFVMNDTLSEGLTFNGDVTVTVNGKTLTEGTGYDLEQDGQNISIIFKNFVQYKDIAGKDIVVTYSATVNEKANLSPVEGNPNTVTLTYSNNPNEVGTGTPGTPDVPGNPDKPGPDDDDITGTTPKSETKTYVTGIQITKVDDKNNTLTGAKFSISGTTQKVVIVNKEIYKPVKSVADGETAYYMLKDGTYTDVAPVTDKTAANYTADKYDSTTQIYVLTTEISKENMDDTFQAEGYVNEKGVLTFTGLNAGTYTITELVAPNGYNLLKDPITVTINEKADMDNANWTVTKGDDETVTANDDNLFAFNVVNKAGTELPSTGGIGTTIFYVVGAILVVGAGVLLVSKKRMNG